MVGAERIDYGHDSLAEIILKQKEIIELQGGRLIELAMQNAALREDAETLMSEEHQRYAEVLILLENWLHAHVAEGHREVDARALLTVFREVFEYAEEDKEPAWFEAAALAMGGLT